MINLCLESVLLFLACYVSILYAVIPVFENISKWLLNGTLFFVLFPFFWQTSDDAVPQPVVLRSWCNHCAAKFWRPSEGTPCTWYGMIFLCWECIFAWSGPDFEMFCFCDLWVSLYQKTILCWHLVFADEGTQGSSTPVVNECSIAVLPSCKFHWKKSPKNPDRTFIMLKNSPGAWILDSYAYLKFFGFS